MKVLIVGTGLIGGSFGLTLKANGHELGGFDQSRDHLEKAKQIGLIQRSYHALTVGLQWADAVILSIPVTGIKEMLPQILDQLRSDQFVIDFGSTKANICRQVTDHPNRSQFLAAHPIAGTEYSGPTAAFQDLYLEKTMIQCEPEKTEARVKSTFREWCRYSHMKIVDMTAEDHDLHLAYISHLSHVIAYSLSNAVLEKERDGKLILELAGSGFASTVRLAKSSPEMWTPIFMENKEPLTHSINDLLEKLNTLKSAIESGDQKALQRFLEEGRKIRKILE